MEQIKDTIGRLLDGIRNHNTLSGQNDPEAWLKKVLTKKELRHIKCNYFRNGTISVNVDSSVWLYQLNLRKKDLLFQLTQESSIIQDIHFRLGEVK